MIQELEIYTLHNYVMMFPSASYTFFSVSKPRQVSVTVC